MTSGKFNWLEYSVFGSMLGVSSLIGVYYGCVKGGQDTVEGYLLGGKHMSVFPIAMSLISSYVSGITMLGFPNEMYTYGSQFLTVNIANITATIVTVTMILPVFYKLQLLSVFEYMEMRFDSKIRKLCSLMYIINLFTYVPIVIYGPALALNLVSDMNIHLITPIVCVVCIFYTTLGGLKAVVLTDTIQGVIMFGSTVVIVIVGLVRVGGINIIFQNAIEGNRLEFFNMNPDPTMRMSFWMTIIFFFQATADIGVSPAGVQRFISLPTLKQARSAIILMCIGSLTLLNLSFILSLLLYSEFKGCDPLKSKIIEKSDQILPLYVSKITENIPGLSGLFLSGIVCAALSTMSTCLNTVAGTIYEDFIEPLFKKKLNDKHASLVMKVLVVVFGAVCTYLVTIVEKLGAIAEISFGFMGVSSGANIGLFFLGLFFPRANAKGALVGGVTSLLVMMWIVTGSSLARINGQIVHPTKPLSVESCQHSFNLTTEILPNNEEVFYLYRLSFFSYCFVGCLIVIFVGMLVSFATGFQHKKTLNQNLISPVIRKVKKTASYDSVKIIEEEGIPPSSMVEMKDLKNCS